MYNHKSIDSYDNRLGRVMQLLEELTEEYTSLTHNIDKPKTRISKFVTEGDHRRLLAKATKLKNSELKADRHRGIELEKYVKREYNK